jgi:4-hydroxy-tetrahydrodipicolinate synthase
MECTFRGSFPALPTPFVDGRVDWEALDALVDWHLESGTDGFVVCGTSGEGATLTPYERNTAIERVVARAAGRVPVIAGVGTNATASTVEGARFAAEAGADGVLVVAPYYNKPQQSGMLLHFGAVAEAVDLPVVLYNVPGRTSSDLLPATVAELRRRHPNIVAIKEASNSLPRARELRDACDIALIAGEDALIAKFMALGGVGVIGVVPNIVPSEVAELCRVAAPAGAGSDAARAAELTSFLAPLIKALFVESNPVPVKAALAAMGRCNADVRLPLAPLSDESRAHVHAALGEAGLV